MNSSVNVSLPFYNSIQKLTTTTSDLFYVFVVPAISILGILLKTISIIVLKKIIEKKKENTYYYMITNEIIDLVNCSVIVFTVLIRCGTYCSYGYTFISKLYDMVFYIYFTNTLQQIQTFLEISFCKYIFLVSF
jgi:hypothetical protein